MLISTCRKMRQLYFRSCPQGRTLYSLSSGRCDSGLSLNTSGRPLTAYLSQRNPVQLWRFCNHNIKYHGLLTVTLAAIHLPDTASCHRTVTFRESTVVSRRPTIGVRRHDRNDQLVSSKTKSSSSSSLTSSGSESIDDQPLCRHDG